MRLRIIHPIVSALFLVGCASAVDTVPEWRDPGERAYEQRDYRTAFEIWFPQADAGIAEPQMKIAVMFACGRYVKRDLVEALKWSSLALRRRNELAPQTQRLIAKEMTRKQIEEGIRRAQDWNPRDKRSEGKQSTETIMNKIPIDPDGGNLSDECLPGGWRESAIRPEIR